jgi:hypothetical protein
MGSAKTRTSRRNFLMAVGAGSAATVAAIAAKTSPQGETQEQPKQASATGYKISEHIRNYYRTTLV